MAYCRITRYEIHSSIPIWCIANNRPKMKYAKIVRQGIHLVDRSTMVKTKVEQCGFVGLMCKKLFTALAKYLNCCPMLISGDPDIQIG